ncbi:unnamed protein product, partial [Vitis vinifera]
MISVISPKSSLIRTVISLILKAVRRFSFAGSWSSSSPFVQRDFPAGAGLSIYIAASLVLKIETEDCKYNEKCWTQCNC